MAGNTRWDDWQPALYMDGRAGELLCDGRFGFGRRFPCDSKSRLYLAIGASASQSVFTAADATAAGRSVNNSADETNNTLTSPTIASGQYRHYAIYMPSNKRLDQLHIGANRIDQKGAFIPDGQDAATYTPPSVVLPPSTAYVYYRSNQALNFSGQPFRITTRGRLAMPIDFADTLRGQFGTPLIPLNETAGVVRSLTLAGSALTLTLVSATDKTGDRAITITLPSGGAGIYAVARYRRTTTTAAPDAPTSNSDSEWSSDYAAPDGTNPYSWAALKFGSGVDPDDATGWQVIPIDSPEASGNAGVSSIGAGTGISVNQATGAVTVSIDSVLESIRRRSTAWA